MGRCYVGQAHHEASRSQPAPARPSRLARPVPIMQLKACCAACERSVQADKETAEAGGRVQPKLVVGAPGDTYEREADRVADQVMRMPEPHAVSAGVRTEPPRIRRLCPERDGELRRQPIEEEEEDLVQTKTDVGGPRPLPPNLATQVEVARGGGEPLPHVVRAFFEPRFGRDFSDVRIHRDARAAATAQAVNARAYTIGSDVSFARSQYRPHTDVGRWLLAHELTHVVQQRGGTPQAHGSNRTTPIGERTIQRAGECSDPDFCTPFATTAEAISEERWLLTYFLPAMNAKFGAEVHDLWESYLSRAPGASLARRVFATAGDPIEESFATSGAVEDDQEEVLDLVVSRLSSFPGRSLRPYTYTVASLSNFLSTSEMDDRPIDFSNPFSKAGNIAGGIGSSAAGPDFRKIARANVALEKIPLIGNSGYIDFKLIPFYEVYDAVDLCPGQCGSPAEQVFTIPLSRLEAMGRAFDVPYVVKFQPDPVTKREFYTSLPL